MQLDKKRPYATVTGHDPNVHHLYEQNGKFFNSELDEVDPKTGKIIRTPPHDTTFGLPKPEEQEPESEYVGLKWGEKGPENRVPDELPPEPNLIAVEYDGMPYTVDMVSDHYNSRATIMAWLDKLGGEYLVRDSRKVLWDKLVARVEELEAEQNG